MCLHVARTVMCVIKGKGGLYVCLICVPQVRVRTNVPVCVPCTRALHVPYMCGSYTGR